MAIEYRDDLPITQLIRHLPNRPSRETVRRWIVEGVQSKSGKVVRLQTVRLPGGRASSLEKYDQFIDELQT